MPENNPPAAPLPRDYDRATFSELVPFRSKQIKLLRSPIFWFVLFTAVVNVLLFVARTETLNSGDVNDAAKGFAWFIKVAMTYLLGLALLGFHSYARSDKPILFYLFPVVLVPLLMGSGFFDLIYPLFEALAGGPLIKDENAPLGARFWSAFAGPGLREEFLKAIPALIAAALTVWAAQARWLPRRVFDLVRVRGPLDGVLMGFAAGCGFLFFETSGQYINEVLAADYNQSHNIQAAMGDALLLLLPRVANGWAGHSAWAAVTGYAIGLAVIRPRGGWRIVLVAYLVAAALHGLWDSSLPPAALYFVGGASGLLAVACLMKARQLEASLFGRATATFGSIVVDRPFVAAAPASVPPPAAPPAAAPAWAPPPGAAAPAPAGLSLSVGDLRLSLSRGRVIDFAAEPGLAGRGQGVRAEVTSHPTKPDVLGLRNLGAGTWYARLRDGSLQAVEAQRSLRLAPGVSVDFGGGLVAQVVAG